MDNVAPLKIVYVHERIAEEFNKRFAAKVDALVLEIHGMKQLC
jgi:hypothetical protein